MVDWTKILIGAVVIVLVLLVNGKSTSNEFSKMTYNGFKIVYDNFQKVSAYAQEKTDFQLMYVLYFIYASLIIFGVLSILFGAFDVSLSFLLILLMSAVVCLLYMYFIPANTDNITEVVKTNLTASNQTTIPVDVKL